MLISSTLLAFCLPGGRSELGPHSRSPRGDGGGRHQRRRRRTDHVGGRGRGGRGGRGGRCDPVGDGHFAGQLHRSHTTDGVLDRVMDVRAESVKARRASGSVGAQ